MIKSLISLVIRKVPRKYLQLISHHAARTLGLFYRGKGVSCPVCQAEYRKFLPYGRKGRENALCPNCLSLERHRLMYLFLQRKTNFFSAPLKVLHVAPELCFIERFEKQANLEYLSADIESPLAKIKMDIHAIPFPENHFEVVFCNHVLEHVQDDRKALSEIYRVLKPGGWGILQIPLFHPLPEKTYEDPDIKEPSAREKAFGQSDHVRLYGSDYAERLKEAGFQVKEDYMAAELGPEEASRYALPLNEPIFYVEKK